MSTIIVTGATGFLGFAVAKELRSRGARVIGLGRHRERLVRLEEEGIEAISFDLASAKPQMASWPRATGIVHCAALSSPWGRPAAFNAANVSGTHAAVGIAREAGVSRFVHISSPSIYFRFADQDGLDEFSNLPNPVNAYAATKAESEKIVLKAADLDPVILRPRGIYGPGDSALLPRLLRAAETRPLPLMRDSIAATDLTYVDDVTDAVALALLADPQSRIYNISGGKALSVRDIADRAGRAAGITVRWRKTPWPVVKAYARACEAVYQVLPGRPEPPVTAYGAGLFAFRQTLSLERAKAELGWQPGISFEEGLARTFAERPA